jgi:hypothetical protein
VNSSLQWLWLVSALLPLVLVTPMSWFSSREELLVITRGLQEGNQIGDAGACGLGQGLKVNGSLRQLWLVSLFSLCSVDVVAQLLFEELLAVTLGLQTGNQIGDAGACGLGQGLMANSSLQRLKLVSRFLHCISWQYHLILLYVAFFCFGLLLLAGVAIAFFDSQNVWHDVWFYRGATK